MLSSIRWLCIQVEQCLDRKLSPQGLTDAQAHILLFILDSGEKGSSLTALHQTFGYSMSTLSRIVKRLREKGYVQAQRCQEDDRCHPLFGTEKGKQAAQELKETISAAHRRLFDGFSPEELEDFDRLQEKMTHNLSILMGQRQKEEARS